MPPQPFSRYFFCKGLKDASGNLFLTDREPYTYRSLPDNRFHVVKQGDTLLSLADTYFEGAVPNPASLWWVIADFQPSRILDPTVSLPIGQTLVIPSLRVLTEEIFSESRRQ